MKHTRENKMGTLKVAAALVLAMSISTSIWSAEPKKVTPPTKNVTIEGQVFIVTKGQNAVKLALVPISIVAEDDLMAFLMKQAKTINNTRKELASKLKRLKEEKDAIENETKPDKQKMLELAIDVQAIFMRCRESGEAAFVNCSKSSEMLDKKREVDALNNLMKPNAENEKEIRQAYDSAKNYYITFVKEDVFLDGIEFVPKLGNAKTDPDGKFSVSVPIQTGKKIAVVAKSNRKIVGETEEYRWMVWLRPTKGQNKLSVTLANDNLFETACQECVIYGNLIQAHDIGQ